MPRLTRKKSLASGRFSAWRQKKGEQGLNVNPGYVLRRELYTSFKV
jgi:hypothetical protein